MHHLTHHAASWACKGQWQIMYDCLATLLFTYTWLCPAGRPEGQTSWSWATLTQLWVQSWGHFGQPQFREWGTHAGHYSFRQQWPYGSPSWLGWVSWVYNRGMTFLDPGQGYLKEWEAEPKLCRASSPHRGPGFPSLESISSGKAYCAVIPVSWLLMFSLWNCISTPMQTATVLTSV